MTNVCKDFQVGQKVSVKENGNSCEVTVIAADQTGPTIIEIAAEYLLLEDAAAGVQTRIPAYLVNPVRQAAPVLPSAA